MRLSLDELAAFLDEVFPAEARPSPAELVSVAPGRVRMTLQPAPSMIRPGGIVSGPTLMGLIDFAAYAVVLAHIGPVEMAVTNTLSVSFLRPCRLEPVFADAHLLKLGRRFASIDTRLWQSTEDRIVAQAIVGYALP
ncbi:MAG TPA: PaaI family thioesterase [Sphingomicrobium sp.]|nr:PaaI family thioesterase [Sphingomicrobium sp.]